MQVSQEQVPEQNETTVQAKAASQGSHKCARHGRSVLAESSNSLNCPDEDATRQNLQVAALLLLVVLSQQGLLLCSSLTRKCHGKVTVLVKQGRQHKVRDSKASCQAYLSKHLALWQHADGDLSDRR